MEAAQGGSELPFTGTYEGLETVGTPSSQHYLDATGNATHLGLFAVRASWTVTMAGAIETNSTWTAANGDELFTRFTRRGVFVPPTATFTETQVLMNLTVNARDAMPTGGRLILETAEVPLDDSFAQYDQVIVPGRYFMLAVTDNGTGMDAETKRHLFEPFFTTKDQGKGTGLGLATVYGIVKQTNGYIWVYSEPSQGSTFKIYLPLAGADAQPHIAATVVDAPAHGTETVLLVEDEEGVRHLAQRILEKAGYQVLSASCPAEATELFAEHRGHIDLVLTDVVMPGSSGPDMFQSFAALEPALKVLFMSGYSEESIVRQAGIDRGLPFVQKPFTAGGLLRTVRETLNQPDAGLALVLNEQTVAGPSIRADLRSEPVRPRGFI